MKVKATDPRFSHLQSDARFKKIGKKKNKVKIDNRFKHMFTSEHFNTINFKDKRGGNNMDVAKDNLEKFYELSSGDDEDEEAPVVPQKGNKRKKNTPKEDSASSEDETPQPLKDITPEQSDSSDGESTDDEGALEDVGPDTWDQLNTCTEIIEDSTSKISICNLNWDRMNATDIYVLLHSFLENVGTINKVEIFPSQYGLQQMAQEQEHGPQLEDTEDDNEEYNEAALRRYQIDRLKYYYAIVSCDSIQTADKLYSSLDGVEYQLSSSILDLRYVPEDMEFDDVAPSTVCSSLPDLTMYKPPLFITAALQNSSVKLTWDETDRSRLALTTKRFTSTDLENVDFSAYIASSESEGEADEGGPTLEKYRALLAGTEEEEKENEVDQEMEITWTTGLEDNHKVVEEAEKNEERQENATYYQPDTEDTFFATDEVIDAPKQKKKKKKKRKKGETVEVSKEESELALLMGGEKDERKHFNMKKMMKSKKEDDFQINVDDDRFAAVKSSHLYAIDPSAAEYKDTASSNKLRAVQTKSFAEKESSRSEKSVNSSQTVIDKIKGRTADYKTKMELSKLFKTKNKGVPSSRTIPSSSECSSKSDVISQKQNKTKKIEGSKIKKSKKRIVKESAL